jgi:NADPH-dependent ferric siderophore reductase
MSTFRDEGVGGRGGVGGERTHRRRLPPRPVEVVSVSPLKPKLVSVRLSGPGLEVFQNAAPTSHIKVYLPRLDQAKPLLPEIGPDAAVRPADDSVSVVSGSGGTFSFDPSTTCWWVAGDESAIPAIGTLLDAMPTTASTEVHLEVEVDGADDEIDFESKASLEVFWHHRQATKRTRCRAQPRCTCGGHGRGYASLGVL